MKYTIIAITQNTPGVLYRIADLFLRRKVNIDSLVVHEVDPIAHLSRFSIDIDADTQRAELMVRQMERFVEVQKVEFTSHNDLHPESIEE